MERSEIMRDPWVRIVLAAQRGKGLRLSAEEVARIAGDDAIAANAEMFLDEHGYTLDRFSFTITKDGAQ